MSSPARVPGVAVIGTGYWGQNHVRVFHELGALRAICDVDAARGDELGRRHGIPVDRTLAATLARPEVEAVVIATPAASHAERVREALGAGRDVLVEKPMALTVPEAEELVRTATAGGRILMVGHLLRYHPALEALKALVDAGRLGPIRYLSSNRLNFGRIRHEENILWSFAPHDISAILHLVEEEPLEVSATGGGYLQQEIADVTLSTLRFKSGVQAYIFVSWLHPFKEQKLVVVGEQGMAVFDDTQPADKLVLYEHKVEWQHLRPVARRSDGTTIPLGTDEPLASEGRHFLAAVRDRRPPRTDGAEGVRVLRVLQALSDSLRDRGRLVAVSSRSAVVHPSAVIDPGAVLGEGTKVWHFSHVLTGSRIGRDCNLGQNVVVGPRVTIGDGVKIQNNVSVYEGVTLEDDVFCGPSMVFTNVINPRAHVSRRNQFRPTLVKKGATIGANATVVCGVTIGRHAFIGAGAVVTRDVPDHGLATGVPAKVRGWVCACGVKLDLTNSRATCPECGLLYEASAGGKGIQPCASPSST